MRTSLRVVFCLAVILGGPVGAATTFKVPDSALPDPLVLIAYGDTRFTDADETEASSPGARRALVAKIASEDPAAVFINGDLPLRGVDADYGVYRAETRVWRDKHLRIYPALGNHELSACTESSCLDRWWNAFPELRGLRWYSVALGSKLVGIALDSDAPLSPGGAQRIWLESQIAALDPAVRVVLIVMHHPPVADVQTVKLVDHNPRSNEQVLAAYLGRRRPAARRVSWSAQAIFTTTSGWRRMASLTWFPAAAALRLTRSTARLRTFIRMRTFRTTTSCASNCAARALSAK